MRALFATILFLMLALPATAQQLSAEDIADVVRVEEYFNAITTLKARFTQVGPRGEIAEGWFYLNRPNRLRFEYDPPVPIMVVADGLRLIYYDKELEQENAWPVANTPLGPILGKTVALQKMVRRAEREPGSVRITLVDPVRADEGSLTLVFTDQPLELRQWTVVDAAGLSTVISLTNSEINTRIDPDLFFLPERRPERP